MEYTGTAFSQPLTDFFRPLLRTKKNIVLPEGEFPTKASYEESTFDPAANLYLHIVHFLNFVAEKIHKFQSGYLHLYILAAAIALVLLLIWALLMPWGGNIIDASAIQESTIFPWSQKGNFIK
jgi:hypothetical protein